MPENTSTIIDLIEMYAGSAGTNNSSISKKLIKQVMNLKLRDFANRTFQSENLATLTTGDDDGDGVVDQEYELPQSVMHLNKVNVDGTVAVKIRFEDVDKLKERADVD